MVKRLESSWCSFYTTVEKIKDHHQNALDKIKLFQEGKAINKLENKEDDLFDDDDLQDEYEELTLGKKRKVNLSDIDAAGNLDNFKKDLKKDLDALDNLYVNLQKFENKIEKEIVRPGNLNSSDDKLQTLIKEIYKKRASGENNRNPKVVIFTVYRRHRSILVHQTQKPWL